MNQTLRYCAPNMSDTVLLKIEGRRATITLNDPAKHNRLDPAGLGCASVSAARAAQLEDFIARLPDGWDFRDVAAVAVDSGPA